MGSLTRINLILSTQQPSALGHPAVFVVVVVVVCLLLCFFFKPSITRRTPKQMLGQTRHKWVRSLSCK